MKRNSSSAHKGIQGSFKVLFSILTVLALVLTACAPITPSNNPTNLPSNQNTAATSADSFYPSAQLVPQAFSSEAELTNFLTNAGSSGSQPNQLSGGLYLAPRAEGAMAPTAAVGVKSADSGASNSMTAPDYSTTNNQVAGVDEGDIIKNDGNYIYTTSGTTLFIVSAGSDASVVSKVDLRGQPTGLLLDGDTLLVYGSFYNASYNREHNIQPYASLTYITRYDVSDRKNPSQKDELIIEGDVATARLIGSTAYVITQSNPDSSYPYPILYRGESRVAIAPSDIFRFPMPYNSVEYTTVNSVSMTDGSVKTKTVATDGSTTVYMSENNLFLASTNYINEWRITTDLRNDELTSQLEPKEVALIAKINSVESDILSDGEKQSKVDTIYQQVYDSLNETDQKTIDDSVQTKLAEKLKGYESLEYTMITRLAVSGQDVSVEASSSVPGHLNNQFSLDEYNNVLRVATTVSQAWWGNPIPIDAGTATNSDAKTATAIVPPSWEPTQTRNTLYTLDENLQVLDKLTNIAPGEQIYASRFINDRLYLVTYRQVDPFFVFDLSDPSHIKELGSLKIPGFSTYLQPYDNNTLIGIGHDTSIGGAQQSLKIALFDVTDPANPVQTASWQATDQYASSIAEYEHKALLFDKDKDLLVIPAYNYNWDQTKGTNGNYNGALVFNITKDSISLRGLIDHSAGTTGYSGPLVERSLWIGNLLYTKSPLKIRVNALSDLHAVTTVALEGNNTSPYPVY